jgi:RES domain
MLLQMRVYHVDVAGHLHDLRPLVTARPELSDRDSYVASQALGRELQAGGSAGLVYASVRKKGGVCVAAFRPRTLANCRRAAQMFCSWDGEVFTGVFEQVA